MAERASVFEGVQLGVEATPGVAVAANRRLTALSVDLNPTVETDPFRPMGTKFDSLVIPGRDWSTFDAPGRLTYTESIYPLNSAFGTGVITTPAGGTLSREHDFTISNSGPDSPKTYTAERGSSVRAERAPHLLWTDWGFNFTRTAGEMTGGGIARALEDGVALTATPTAVALIPVLPKEVSVYLDDTAAALGTTKLTRVIAVGGSVGNRANPLWVLDAAQTSFVTTVELAPAGAGHLQVEADAAGMGILATLRAGATKFLRVEAVGATIEGALAYLWRFDAAIKFNAAGGRGDQDGVWAVDWPFTWVQDATWGKAVGVKVRNTLTAL